MKRLYTTLTLNMALFTFVACSHSEPVAPSQNSALNSISNSSGKEKSGIMQQGLDSWLEKEWSPAIQKDEQVREKYMQETEESGEIKYRDKENKPFTLQEFIDKSDAYFKAKESELDDSHVQKLESMPVIGK